MSSCRRARKTEGRLLRAKPALQHSQSNWRATKQSLSHLLSGEWSPSVTIFRGPTPFIMVVGELNCTKPNPKAAFYNSFATLHTPTKADTGCTRGNTCNVSSFTDDICSDSSHYWDKALSKRTSPHISEHRIEEQTYCKIYHSCWHLDFQKVSFEFDSMFFLWLALDSVPYLIPQITDNIAWNLTLSSLEAQWPGFTMYLTIGLAN